MFIELKKFIYIVALKVFHNRLLNSVVLVVGATKDIICRIFIYLLASIYKLLKFATKLHQGISLILDYYILYPIWLMEKLEFCITC